ncbi:MAG: hypothetical protein GWP19_09345 [Planctomycetia bacterium]|nr:hypothetical protein [Planctomycetia bacterium]
MVSSNDNELNVKDYFSLYHNVFFQELHAIVSAKEYKSKFANFSREDKKKIKANQDNIAVIATQYFIDKKGYLYLLKDEKKVDELVDKSIIYALKNC